MGRGSNQKATNPLFGPRTGVGVTPIREHIELGDTPLFEPPGGLSSAEAQAKGFVYTVHVSPCGWSDKTWYPAPDSRRANPIDANLRREVGDLLNRLEAEDGSDSDLVKTAATFWLPVDNEPSYRGLVRRLEEIADKGGIDYLDLGLELSV